MKAMLETERLYLRTMDHGDFDALSAILGDVRVMAAWEHGFTSAEVRGWIDHNMARYERNGYSYFIAVDKRSGEIVGQIGLLDERLPDGTALGIGYILKYDAWGKGYAVEGAGGCLVYGFQQLRANEIVATIRPENHGSVRVALSLGMEKVDSYAKHYQGKEMVHDVYAIKKEAFEKR